MKRLLLIIFFALLASQVYSQVTHANIGTGLRSGDGETGRSAFTKLNQNDYNLSLSGTASGTDTYTVTIAAPAPGYTTGITAPTAYSQTTVYRITFTNANTGPSTLNFNSAGAKSLVKNGSTALSSGDIPAGSIKILVYDGTNLQIVGDGGGGGGTWGSITGTLSNQTDLNTQLGLKAPLASPTFTGTPIAPTAAASTSSTQIATTAFVKDSSPKILILSVGDEYSTFTAGTKKLTFRMPYAMTVTAVRASLNTAQSSGSLFTVDINESGITIISTKLTIDNTEKTSTTAATPPVISDSALADDAEITIDFDFVGTGGIGPKVYIIGY